MSLTRHFTYSLHKIMARAIHSSAIMFGPDSRDKRLGHIELPDTVSGERGPVRPTVERPFEYVDENLMDKVINNVRFKDIPILYLRCTRNNTKMTLTQGDGTRIALKSAGTEGFKNCRKGTTVAAQAVAKRVLTCASDNEVNQVRLVFDGLGPGRNPAYQVIENSDLTVVSLTDRTQAAEPWNQRPRKAKRI